MKAALRIGALSLVVAFASAGAQSSGGTYRMERSVLAGGGSLSGGTFALCGTFGQSATTSLSGAGYGFYGGFWSPNVPAERIFANGFEPQGDCHAYR